MPVDLARLGPDARAQAERQLGPQPRAGRIRAKRTMVDGIIFPSMTQARVYERVRSELRPGQVMGLDVRLPVPALMSGTTRKVPKVEIDFVVWERAGDAWRIARLIDAKPKAKEARSRDWYRGKLAIEASYGVAIEEADR